MAFFNYKNTYLERLPDEIQDHIAYFINKSNYDNTLAELKIELTLNTDINFPSKYYKKVLEILEYYKHDNYSSIPFIDFIVWLNHNKNIITKKRYDFLRILINELYSDLYAGFNSFKTPIYFDNIRLVLYNLTYLELIDFKNFIVIY